MNRLDRVQVHQAEKAANRALRIASEFCTDPELEADLKRAGEIMAEVRHFACCWDDNTDNEANKSVSAYQARDIRNALINRLVTFLTPSEV